MKTPNPNRQYQVVLPTFVIAYILIPQIMCITMVLMMLPDIR